MRTRATVRSATLVGEVGHDRFSYQELEYAATHETGCVQPSGSVVVAPGKRDTRVNCERP